MSYPKKITLSSIEYKKSVFSISPPLTVHISTVNKGESYMARCEEMGDRLTVEDKTSDGAITMMCAKIIHMWDNSIDGITQKWVIPDDSDIRLISRICEVSEKSSSGSLDDINDLDEEWEKIFERYLVK